MARTSRRLGEVRLKVFLAKHKGSADPDRGQLAARDELPYAIPRDSEELGGLRRSHQSLSRISHVAQRTSAP